MEKALLREKGATVIEYEADYSVAVEQGRQKLSKIQSVILLMMKIQRIYLLAMP